MEDKLYWGFYRKLKVKWIAKLFAFISYQIFKIFYHFTKKFKNDLVSLNSEDAYKKITKICPKPEKKYILEIAPCNAKLALSIIIPVYNTEKFLENCISSVLNQKTQYEYEVIIVNDGSTDKSANILKKFSKDSKIVLIEQENKGFSGARNTGLNHASGKYFMFVDSDDILSEHAVESLLSEAFSKNADIVESRYYSFYDEYGKKYISDEKKNELLNKEDIPFEEYPGFPWGKVFKRELFEHIRFFECFWFEDTIIQYIQFGLCQSFVCIEDVCYGYRRNRTSISFTAKQNLKSIDTYWIIEEMLKSVEELHIDRKEYIYKLTLRQLGMITYYRLKTLDDDIMKQVFVLSCTLIKKIRPENIELEGMYADIEKAFLTGNYALWKLCSMVMK